MQMRKRGSVEVRKRESVIESHRNGFFVRIPYISGRISDHVPWPYKGGDLGARRRRPGRSSTGAYRPPPSGTSSRAVFIQDFPAKSPHFSAKRKIFPQIHRNTPENSKVHPIRRRIRRTETYPILETFLFLITTRRFGGVGAPEGREKVPDHIFPQIKKQMCFWRKIMESTEFSRKICENGVANL
jgi:hypothetical protein